MGVGSSPSKPAGPCIGDQVFLNSAWAGVGLGVAFHPVGNAERFSFWK